MISYNISNITYRIVFVYLDLSDVNFIISNNGVRGHNLVRNGFNFMWAGARANKGAKGGKIGYELQVISHY